MKPCRKCGAPHEERAACTERRSLPDLPKQYREMPFSARRLTREEAEELLGRAEPENAQPLYELSISSEEPVQHWWGRETLSHKKSAIDSRYLDLGLAVCVDHKTSDQVGGCDRKWWVDKETKKLKALARYSRSQRGRDIQQDVDDGIRGNTSVGYIIVEARLTKQGASMAEDEWEVTRWIPAEVSMVSVPADVTVGVGRSEERGATYPVQVTGGPAAEKERDMHCHKCGTTHEERSACPTGERGGTTTATIEHRNGGAPSNPPDANAVRAAMLAEQERWIGAAEANGCTTTQIREWIGKGLSEVEVLREIAKLRTTQKLSQPPSERIVDLNGSEAARYSYLRAVRGFIAGKLEGLEREVHEEIERHVPVGHKRRGGLLVPMRLAPPSETRAMGTNVAGGGAELMVEQKGELIELLRNKAVATQLGVRVLADLEGPVSFPKQTTASTAFWMGQNPPAPVAPSQPGFGLVSLEPKTLMGLVPVPRQLVLTAGYDSEQLVRDDMMAQHALAIDRTFFHGKGVGNEPIGIYNIAGVQPKAMGGVPDYPKIVDMTALCADKNALQGSLGFVTTPLMAGVMKTKPVVSGGDAVFIWTGPIGKGEMAGYPAFSTNQLSKTMNGSVDVGGAEQAMIFADWSQGIIGMWAAMEVIVDETTRKTEGIIELCTFQLVDHIVRHEESFVKATGATLS